MRTISVGGALRSSIVPLVCALSAGWAGSSASAATLTLNFDSSCPFPSFTSAGVISCGTTTAPPPSAPPPPAPPPPTDGGDGTVPSTCNNLKVVNLGALSFDGTRYTSTGFDNNAMVIATLKIPSGLPTSQASLAVFEYADQATYETVWVSKTACEAMPTTRSAYYSYSLGATMYWSIGGTATGMLFAPGETWYIHVMNRSPFGKTTCNNGGTCNIGIKVYKPN